MRTKIRRPILVTGAHRSGTTWVGKMLAAGRQATYISEPLNLWHRPGVFRTPVKHWYTYICPENETEYLSGLQETASLRFHFLLEVKSLRSIKDFLRMCRDGFNFSSGRLFERRALLKDPFAVFSTQWFTERLNCQVVVTIRHPAAFTNSLMKLDWPFNFEDLLSQPLLMRDWLEPFRDEMEKCLGKSNDMIAQSCLLWRMVYQVVWALQSQLPGLRIVRHEDLSRAPIEGYQELYAHLGLNFSQRAEETIKKSSAADNPKELSRRAVHSIQLDSQANLDAWKRRLQADEIRRIRNMTEEVASLYYSDQDWN